MCILYAESIKGETNFLESLKAKSLSASNVLDACKREVQDLEESENGLDPEAFEDDE